MEHRWGERVKVDFPVRITAHPFAVRDGRLTDLSVSGAFIEAILDVRALTRIDVSVRSAQWSKHDAPVISAYVTRKYRDGIGIEWCEFAPAAVGRILRRVVRRPYTLARRPIPPASVTISRLSGTLLKHGD
jgi:hypothetical protein